MISVGCDRVGLSDSSRLVAFVSVCMLCWLVASGQAGAADSVVTIGNLAEVTTTGTADVCADQRVVDTGGSFDGNWCGTPTAVELASFVAVAREGFVLLEWETASEIDNAGFNLWRSESESADYTRVNVSLIPSEGGSCQGAEYSFEDGDVLGGRTYWYKLEDIDCNGVSSFHGPVQATALMVPGWGPQDAEGSTVGKGVGMSKGGNMLCIVLFPAVLILLWRRRR